MSNSHIPPELITNILSHLPVKSLARFLSVSRQWYDLISDSGFVKKHLNRSVETNRDRTIILLEHDGSHCGNGFSFNFDDDEDQFCNAVKMYPPLQHCDILDCCDGLVCLLKGREEVVIWNPLLRKYRKLPSDKPKGVTDFWFPQFAFCHDHQNDDYKVLRLLFHYNDLPIEIKVYSLKSQRWKKVEEQWPNKEICHWESVSLNGAVHWLVADYGVLDKESLLAFDLASEKFKLYTTPVSPDLNQETRLEVLGGHLCFLVNVFEEYNDVWFMKEYGVDSSWTRIYKIERDAVTWDFERFEYYKPLMFSKNGKKVLLEEHWNNNAILVDHVVEKIHSKNLIWYDIEKKQGKRVQNWSFPDAFRTATCIGSLLLLDGDNVIDPWQRNASQSEGLNLLLKAVDELENEMLEG
nr:F-box protein CPR1-like [Quercus suber]POE66591.1 f-box protein cpr30 [Quercus suber]